MKAETANSNFGLIVRHFVCCYLLWYSFREINYYTLSKRTKFKFSKTKGKKHTISYFQKLAYLRIKVVY